MADNQYRNKTVINQKGATIEIVNSTDREDLKLSQFSGSNITLNNVVNSELATNNKQTKVINDSFESVGKDKNTFVGGNSVDRVVETSYNLRGFENDTQLGALSSWRDEMEDSSIPGLFGQFIRLRGSAGATGYAVPPVKDSATPAPQGERTYNSTFNQERIVLSNAFSTYCPVPLVDSDTDEVTDYEPVAAPGPQAPAGAVAPNRDDVYYGAGPVATGTNAPGVRLHGPDLNAATEGGTWAINEDRTDEKLTEELVKLQAEKLNEIEQQIGNGGDEIQFIKRNKFITIGGEVNNFPSIRIDPQGRSQPIEMAVGLSASFTNMDFVPHVEEVNNDLNFPCGDYTLNVGNRYNVIVGSGGMQMKTSGSLELGGTAVKVASNKLNLMASEGMHLHSPNLIELNSDKSISLRSKRQIYIEPNLGVKGNTVIGGGLYVEGELFVQHITAPVEIQQSEDTTLLGKFNCKCEEELPIGTVTIGGQRYIVHALPTDNLIINYPHSHHFKNIPIKVMDKNADVRQMAMCSGINNQDVIAAAVAQNHERKPVQTFSSLECTPEAKDLEEGCLQDYVPETEGDEEECDVRFSNQEDPNSSSSGSIDPTAVQEGASQSDEARREAEQRGIQNLIDTAQTRQGTDQGLLDARRRSQQND
tara:strand:+ start:843 stop:2783 length:1941 start_codon:yes stop_codon:yes gene_type:complete